MLINALTEAAVPRLGLTVDPIAALRFVQAELSTQIAGSLAARVSRLEAHLDKLARSLQLDQSMRAIATDDAPDLPSFNLFVQLDAGSLSLLDQFVDGDPLLLSRTRSDAEALAETMADVGVAPPPVMTPVLTSTVRTLYAKSGAVISASTSESFLWIDTAQRAAIAGTVADLGHGVVRATLSTQRNAGDERIEVTTTTQYLIDRKANRRFTEEQLLAARSQIAVAQQSMLPELQYSASIVAAQTVALNLLILQQDHTRGTVIRREGRLVQQRTQEDFEQTRYRERQLDERRGKDVGRSEAVGRNDGASRLSPDTASEVATERDPEPGQPDSGEPR